MRVRISPVWVSGNWDTGWQVSESTDITCVGVRELGYRMAGKRQYGYHLCGCQGTGIQDGR